MRKIAPAQILIFVLLLSLATTLAIATDWALLGSLPFGDFRGVVLSLAGVVLLYVYSILIYRVVLAVYPLHPGEIEIGSQQEFVYHVYILSYLILFYPIMRSGFMPTPLMRAFYLALGTRLGTNTYSQGIIHDPPFVEIGDNSVVGQSALLVPHVIEGSKLAHYAIRIGNNVTIGAHAVVLADVVIGDNAIVATGSIVTKGTRIGIGEIWGGMPARPLGKANAAL